MTTPQDFRYGSSAAEDISFLNFAARTHSRSFLLPSMSICISYRYLPCIRFRITLTCDIFYYQTNSFLAVPSFSLQMPTFFPSQHFLFHVTLLRVDFAVTIYSIRSHISTLFIFITVDNHDTISTRLNEGQNKKKSQPTSEHMNVCKSTVISHSTLR